jgi:hypothetical protein
VVELSLEISLDWQLSKNRSKTRNKYTGQTVYNANQSKIDRLKDEIYYLSKSAGCVWEKKRVWVFITLHKKSLVGDVANMVDSVSDAIKKAILVDDNLFSFVLDWVVDKKNIIEIKILQELKD